MITLTRSTAGKARPLQKRRDAATLSKLAFCLRVVEFSILSNADGIAASRGEWPSAMDGLLPLLTDDQQASILIEWGASAEVARMNVNVLTLAAWLGISDATLDEIFYIEVP